MTPGGLVTCISSFGPKGTMDRLAVAVTTRGISVMARIDHAAAAAAIGMELRPTEVLIFGNPRAGTPLMQAVQTGGIDFTAEGAGLAGRGWDDLACLQRSAVARPASRCRHWAGS